MELSVIQTEEQYQQYLDWVDDQFDKIIRSDSPKSNKLEVALLLIKQYENEHYAIPFPDPIESNKLKISEMGLKNKVISN